MQLVTNRDGSQQFCSVSWQSLTSEWLFFMYLFIYRES